MLKFCFFKYWLLFANFGQLFANFGRNFSNIGRNLPILDEIFPMLDEICPKWQKSIYAQFPHWWENSLINNVLALSILEYPIHFQTFFNSITKSSGL